MQRSPETSIKAAHGGVRTAALGVAALTFSHLASAGVASVCDSRTIDPPDLDIPATELTIELVELGSTAPVDLDVNIDAGAIALQAPPDVDAMLKQMFDIADDFEPAAVRPMSPARGFPLADLTPPTIESDASTNATEATDDNADNEVLPPAVSTRIPGLSDDDLRRYRSRMYRTDI